MITVSAFPNLLQLSYQQETVPLSIQFSADSLRGREFLRDSAPFRNMYEYFYYLNTDYGTPTHYFLNGTEFNDLVLEPVKRETYSMTFLNKLPSLPLYGVICLLAACQYVYLYLPASHSEITDFRKNYLACAYFRRDQLLHFQQAFPEKGNLFPDAASSFNAYQDQRSGEHLHLLCAMLAYFVSARPVLANEALNGTNYAVWVSPHTNPTKTRAAKKEIKNSINQ